MLVECWRDARKLLEEFAQVAVAHTKVFGYLLYGKVLLQRLPDTQSRKVYHVHTVMVLAKLYAPFQSVHQSHKVVDDARQYLLRVWSLLLRPLVCFLVQSDDICTEAHMIDRFSSREEARPHPVIDVLALETYPIALPSAVVKRMVGMPLSWEEQEQVASLKRNIGHMIRAEHSLALCDI